MMQLINSEGFKFCGSPRYINACVCNYSQILKLESKAEDGRDLEDLVVVDIVFSSVGSGAILSSLLLVLRMRVLAGGRI